MSMERNPHILVIDDDRVFLHWISNVIRGAGMTVSTMVALDDGDLKANLAQADVLLLDVALPGPNGFEILSGIRNDPATRDVPVLMLTAQDPISYRLKGLALGADDYMAKPPNQQELLLRIRALLRRSRTTTQESKRLRVQSPDRTVSFIDPRRIGYLEAANNFCWAHMDDGTRYMTFERISELVEKLAPEFKQVHRSFAVNVARVSRMHRPDRRSLFVEIDIPGNPQVPVSLSHRSGLTEILEG